MVQVYKAGNRSHEENVNLVYEAEGDYLEEFFKLQLEAKEIVKEDGARNIVVCLGIRERKC